MEPTKESILESARSKMAIIGVIVMALVAVLKPAFPALGDIPQDTIEALIYGTAIIVSVLIGSRTFRNTKLPFNADQFQTLVMEVLEKVLAPTKENK